MKFMGSKARLSKDIAPIINNIIAKNNIDSYIEPFVGGANMIDKIECEKKSGSDVNEYLIAMWNALQNGWEIPSSISRDEYNDIKDNMDKYSIELVSVAGFCATYNAKWFGGYAGVVTTKTGVVRNYYDESIRNIEKQLPQLEDVRFGCFGYEIYQNIKDKLFYCDPPYKDTTQYDHNKGFDHEVFYDWCRETSRDNIVLISEYEMPSDFICIFEKQLTTTLDKNSRKKSTEKLFVHKSNLDKVTI